MIYKKHLDELAEAIEDPPILRMPTIPNMLSGINEKMNERPVIRSEKETRFDHVDEEQAEQLLDAMEERSRAERKRLAKRLEDLKALDAEVKKEQQEEKQAAAGKLEEGQGKKKGSAV